MGRARKQRDATFTHRLHALLRGRLELLHAALHHLDGFGEHAAHCLAKHRRLEAEAVNEGARRRVVRLEDAAELVDFARRRRLNLREAR